MTTERVSDNNKSQIREEKNNIVSKEEMKQLLAKTNSPGLIRLLFWVLVVFSSGWLIYMSMGTIWLFPALLIHGFILVHHFSLQHECIHYSAFRDRWINDLVAHVCGFILLIPPRYFRYEHTAHHNHTNQKELDSELIDLPSSFWQYFVYLSSFTYRKLQLAAFVRTIIGRLSDEEKKFMPNNKAKTKVIWEARIMAMLYLLVIIMVIKNQWYAPIWYWWIPVLLSEPFMRAIRMTEHVGCPQKDDFKVNTRTNIVNFLLRFLCWNMNYHAEHHFAPSVPFHALPNLHNKLKGKIKIESGGYFGAHKDIISQIKGLDAGIH